MSVSVCTARVLAASTLAAALVTWPSLTVAQTPPFFAPAETSGSLTVRLYPMENVTSAAPRLVTFGVPFPRGSLTASGLATLRVARGGVELPAFVEALTPWRHVTQPSLDGTSVRVARVQLQYAFSARYPAYEEITVEWGVTARTQNVTTLQDPRLGWHTVTTGSFVAANGVAEPDVYAVLPSSHLAKGLIKPTRMSPMPASVPEAREDPFQMDAVTTWPGFEEMDHAAKNNLYTVINEDDPRVTVDNQIAYKTDFEPWLYDRSSAMFVVYLRSGHLKALREAVRSTEFYRTQLYPPGTVPAAAVGCFKLKTPNPTDYIGGNGAMYSYDEPLAYTYWLTGDTRAAESIPWVVNCHEMNDENTRWSPPPAAWSERHTAFRLLANVVSYEVFGNIAERNRIVSGSGDFIWHQNGADGLVPNPRIDGALWHPLSQGEGDPPPNGDRYQASPWRSALLVDAMVRAYAVTESAGIGHFVRRMGTFLIASTKIVNDTEMDYRGREVDYITYIDGTTYIPEGTTHHHALEVAASLAWADYFGRLLGPVDPQVARTALELYATYDFGVNYWIRPTAPPLGLAAYRISPPRRWAWEHRPSGSFAWLLSQTSVQPPTELRATAIAGNTVTVAWTPPSEGVAPTGYLLEGGITAGQVLATLPAGTSPPFTFAAPTGRFYIRVHAIAPGQRSAASNEIQIAVNVPLPPSAPTGLRGFAGGSTLALSWINPPGSLDGVRVVVSGAVSTSLALPVSESMTYVGVPPGSYSFAVQAFNSAGSGTASSPITLAFPGTCPGAPAPPSGLVATSVGRTITLTWNPPLTGPAVTQYTVVVSGAFNGSLPTAARTLSGTVGPGSYTVSVTASNPCGTSAPTAAQTVTIS